MGSVAFLPYVISDTQHTDNTITSNRQPHTHTHNAQHTKHTSTQATRAPVLSTRPHHALIPAGDKPRGTMWTVRCPHVAFDFEGSELQDVCGSRRACDNMVV